MLRKFKTRQKIAFVAMMLICEILSGFLIYEEPKVPHIALALPSHSLFSQWAGSAWASYGALYVDTNRSTDIGYVNEKN